MKRQMEGKRRALRIRSADRTGGRSGSGLSIAQAAALTTGSSLPSFSWKVRAFVLAVSQAIYDTHGKNHDYGME